MTLFSFIFVLFLFGTRMCSCRRGVERYLPSILDQFQGNDITHNTAEDLNYLLRSREYSEFNKKWHTNKKLKSEKVTPTYAVFLKLNDYLKEEDVISDNTPLYAEFRNMLKPKTTQKRMTKTKTKTSKRARKGSGKMAEQVDFNKVRVRKSKKAGRRSNKNARSPAQQVQQGNYPDTRVMSVSNYTVGKKPLDIIVHIKMNEK